MYQSALPRTLQDHALNYSTLLAGVRSVEDSEKDQEDNKEEDQSEEDQSEEDEEQRKENKKSLLQLYLLKLLAESDVRQLSWLKEVCAAE